MLAFLLRRLCDLQVASVLYYLTPWLAELKGKVLEVGCGAQPYRHLVPAACRYQGLDWKKSKEFFKYYVPDTIYYDGNGFPLESCFFDAVFHTEVLEHVYHVAGFLSECKRVLKPGSEMFFTVPFQARYHYIPHDFWRFTPASLQQLLEGADFKDVRIMSRGSDVTVAVYKIVSILYKWAQSGFMGKIMFIIFSPFWGLLLCVGHLSLRIRMGSEDDCLGYAVIARA